MSDTAPDDPDATSPGSERETREAQQIIQPPPDVDPTAVKVAPGTGGPDDAGDIDIEEEADIHIPGREPAD